MISKKQIMIIAAVVGLCVWGVLLYSNTLKAPFVFDDEQFVIRNPAIKHLGDSALWQQPNYRKRFVAFSSFALNYHFHGHNVTGYHAVNLAIHLFVALSVFWFVLLLFGTPRMREEKISQHRQALAFLSAALFLVHPVQTQAVTYISQRFECLAALFYVLSVCLYLKGRMSPGFPFRKAVCFMLSAVAAVSGVFTKETVFTLPFALILIEWVFLKEPVPEGPLKEHGPFWKRPWVYIGAVFLLMGLIFFSHSLDLRKVFATHVRIGITSSDYLLTQFRVILKYIELLFLPLHQNLDYDFPLSSGLLEGPTLSSAFVLLAILFLAFRSIRRFPLIGFGVIWFFLTLSVTSSFMPLKDVIFEHRLYLPSVGFAIAFCAGFYYLTSHFRTAVLFLGMILLAFSFLIFQRNGVWADEVRLWEDTVRKSPNKARPYVNLGKAYRKRGKSQKAVSCYLKALKLHRKGDVIPLAQIYVNLGAAYGDQKKYREEIAACLQAIKLNPRNPQAYSNAGYIYSLLGDYKKALAYGGNAVRIAPGFDEGWNNLGVTYGKLGQYRTAASLFKKALTINPRYKEARSNLAFARSLMTKKNYNIRPLSGSGEYFSERSPDAAGGRASS